MDLSYPAEAETFRKEIRGWLEDNLPQGWFDEGFEMSPDQKKQFNEEWPQKLYEGGWICATWPTEYPSATSALTSDGLPPYLATYSCTICWLAGLESGRWCRAGSRSSWGASVTR